MGKVSCPKPYTSLDDDMIEWLSKRMMGTSIFVFSPRVRRRELFWKFIGVVEASIFLMFVIDFFIWSESLELLLLYIIVIGVAGNGAIPLHYWIKPILKPT